LNAVFVDFKRAFDLVCHQALFLKLAKNGITGNLALAVRLGGGVRGLVLLIQ